MPSVDRRQPPQRVGDVLPDVAATLGIEGELRFARQVSAWQRIIAERVPAATGSSSLISPRRTASSSSKDVNTFVTDPNSKIVSPSTGRFEPLSKVPALNTLLLCRSTRPITMPALRSANFSCSSDWIAAVYSSTKPASAEAGSCNPNSKSAQTVQP